MKGKARDEFSHFGAKSLTGLLILLLIIGCRNPFATRDPEDPEQRRSSWIPPTVPKIVMDNLKNAINERNENNYLKCLAKDTTGVGQVFHFEADRTTILKNPSMLNWNFQSESDYIHLLFSRVPRDSLILLDFKLPDPHEYISKDSLVYIRDYDLYVHHTMESDQCPRRVRGRGEFHLSQKHDGDWIIHFWRDTAIEDYPSWSDLKAYSW